MDSNCDGRFSDYYLRFTTDCYQSIGKETYFSSIRRFNIVMQAKNNDIHKVVSITKDIKQKSRIFRMLGAILYSQTMYQLSVEYYEQALAIHEEIGDKAAMADDYNNLGSMSYKSRQCQESFRIS